MTTGAARPGTGTDDGTGAETSTDTHTWRSWVEQESRKVAAAGQWRAPRTFTPRPGSGTTGRVDGHDGEIVSFAANDYLGLATHPAVVAAAHRALDRWGAGAGASRLVTGSRPVHRELETALAEWKGTEAAVTLPTGFAANLAALAVAGSSGAHLFSDALNHASIVDGCRTARAHLTVFPHRDLDALDGLMAAATGRPVVVSDTVFSMDGDVADLDGLAALARRRGALLVLDEAHAVLGPDPAPGLFDGVEVLRIGTLSKALGSVGGFVAADRRWVDLLVNRARPYIFTTAPAPAAAAAALAAVELVRSEEGAARRDRLAALSDRVATAVGLVDHGTPIVPVVVGEEAAALGASAALLDRGLWVPAIRPPTVAPGTSRLRVTLSAEHTDAQVDDLVAALGGAVPAGAMELAGDRAS